MKEEKRGNRNKRVDVNLLAYGATAWSNGLNENLHHKLIEHCSGQGPKMKRKEKSERRR
jgi:hypothetical protein